MKKQKEYRVALGNDAEALDRCIDCCKEFDSLKDARAFARRYYRARLVRVVRSDDNSVLYCYDLRF